MRKTNLLQKVIFRALLNQQPQQRYLPVYNAPHRNDGTAAFYDTTTKHVVYSKTINEMAVGNTKETGKKSFVLYMDAKELWESLSNEQAGKFIKHIYDYAAGDEF